MKIKPWLYALMLTSMSGMAVSAQAVELIQNGDFEIAGQDDYDVEGWQVAEEGVLGSVFRSTSTQSEVTANTTVGAFQGQAYGLLDNYGLASNALYQTFTTSALQSASLTFQLFVNNQHNVEAIDAAGLDHTVDATDQPNQHVRVDVLRANSSPFSTNTQDILQTIYVGGATDVGAVNPYRAFNFDLTSTVSAGGTFVLRFASVANQNSLQLGLDNVSIQGVSAVPEAHTISLMLAGLGMLGWSRRRQSR